MSHQRVVQVDFLFLYLLSFHIISGVLPLSSRLVDYTDLVLVLVSIFVFSSNE